MYVFKDNAMTQIFGLYRIPTLRGAWSIDDSLKSLHGRQHKTANPTCSFLHLPSSSPYQRFLSLLRRTKPLVQADVAKIEVAWVDSEVGRASLVFEPVQEAAKEYCADLRVVP